MRVADQFAQLTNQPTNQPTNRPTNQPTNQPRPTNRPPGVYIWGKTWIQAKTQAECYDYLFGAAVKMAQLGIDASRAPAPLGAAAAANGAANGAAAGKRGAPEAAANGIGAGAKRARLRRPPAAVVLDIEGTVAPISFVADTMFSYARQHVRAYLEDGYDSAEVQGDVAAVQAQAAADGAAGVPEAAAGKAAVVDAVVAWVEAAIAADRKVGHGEISDSLVAKSSSSSRLMSISD